MQEQWIADFGEAWSDFIAADGVLRPTLVIPLPSQRTLHLDPDGIIVTVEVIGPDGLPCLLTALCRMSHGESRLKWRKKQLPGEGCNAARVTRKIDEAQGLSGEVYARFECEFFSA